MAKYNDAVCRLCRREGTKLYLKGEKCYSPKCILEKRPYPPGKGSERGRRAKVSDYGIRLREKQKARRIYGIMEKQFKRYFDMASREKGLTGENLLRLLERRLDNVVYRLGFASSRREARLLVSHGHFEVNGRSTNIPSYLVKIGDVVKVKDKSKDIEPIQRGLSYEKAAPGWLELDENNLSGKVLDFPKREDIDVLVNEQMIVEFYSR